MSTPRRWLGDAIRSRPLIGLLLVLLSVLAVLSAALGPLLVRAVGQSGIQAAVDSAGSDATAVSVSTALVGDTTAQSADLVRHVMAASRTGAAAAIWTVPRIWADSDSNLAWSGAGQATEAISDVRVPAPDCADYRLAAGRCPSAAGEIALSVAAAQAAGATIGDRIGLRPPRTSISSSGPGDVPVRLVGTYAPDNADPTLARPGTAAGAAAGITDDPLLMSGAEAGDLQLEVSVHGRQDLAAGLTLAQEPAARASLADLQAALLTESHTVTMDSGLPGVLDAFDAQLRSASILVGVTEVQALLLAVFALAVVLQRIARARTAEWGVGRLRGIPRPRWWASIYVEPAVALLIGAPVGVLAAWAVAVFVVARTLRPGTPVEIGHWTGLTAAAAVTVAFLGALLAVSVPNLRRPLVELIQQRSEAQRLSVVGAVAQSAVLLLAVATGYALVGGGVLQAGGSQLGLLAPGLFALALALIAVRLAVILVRRFTARPPRSVVALVVGRQAARTPSSLNPAVVVTVGVALAVFAVQVLAASERNQGLRADAETGAATVLTVRDVSPTALLAAVETADPSGRSAMAVQELADPADTGVARLVAVDADRFAAVTTWSADWADLSPTALAGALAPATPAPITLTGSRLEVDLAAVTVDAEATTISSSAPADPDLLVTVDTGSRWETVDLGPLISGAGAVGRSGRATSSGGRRSAAVDCAKGCRLANIGLLSDAGAPYRASIVVTGIGTDARSLASSKAVLTDASRWRSRVGDQVSAEPRARATPSAAADGLKLSAYDLDGATPALVLPADAVDPLPAVVSATTGAEPFPGIPNAALGRGLDGQPQLITVAGHASVLPRSLDDGVLVDLAAASKLSDPGNGRRTSEVWLSATAPPSMEQALTKAGLTITARQVRAEVAQSLLREPSTRAAAAAVGLGASALLLTLVAFVAARVADVSRRRPDWRSLRDGGVGSRVVRRMAYVEIALPALLGALLGLACGVLGSVLATPRLPIVDLSTPGPPLDLRVSWLPVGVIGLAVVAVILLVALVGATAETRFRAREGNR